MPEFNVNSDTTAQTSSSLLSSFNQLTEQLTQVQNQINSLLADGYSTPAAQQKFQPYFEEFAKGFGQINQSLQGISSYVKQVGETFASTDSQLGAALPQS
jgi:WXG100 family type VII secretion target